MPAPIPAPDANLLAGLRAPWSALLAHVARVAHAQGVALWLVGGVVRDLLLGLPIARDLDLAVEGDTVALAQTLATELGGRVIAAHAAFGTATVVLNTALTSAATETLYLDLAQTRVETYPHPAALPVVQPADIMQDLFRRDFSINAMALALHPADAGLKPAELLDPCGGWHDLAAGIVRVLYDRSFDEDPTRILRGVRLASRLGLQLDPQTHNLLAAALAQGRLEATTPDRIRTELCLALAEPFPADVLRLADAWHITPHIFAPLRWSAALAARCARARACLQTGGDNGDTYQTQRETENVERNPQLLYAGLLTYDLTATECADLAARYRLPGAAARVLREVQELKLFLNRLSAPGLRNSELDRLLRAYGAIALHVVRCAETSPASDTIAHYLTNLRGVTPLLNGHALQQLGATPGPQLGQLLSELRAARLDGVLVTRDDEENWVVHRLRAIAEQRTTNDE